MSVTLRPYQDEFVADLRGAMRQSKRVLGVAATGAGKTITFAYIAQHACARGNSVIIAAHRAEIVQQISVALQAMGIRHGWIMPGRTQTNDLVQVAMIQTLARRLDRIAPPSLFVIDEAHHATSGAYEQVMARFGDAFVLGVTATPERLDGKGLGSKFDKMVIGPQTRWLVENGFLSQYTYLAPPQIADFSGVKSRMGDYAIDQLAAIMDKATITGDVIGHYQRYLAGRSAIAFCINIAHAEHVSAEFNSAGIASASIDGNTERARRFELLAALGTGDLKVLTSCDLIGEGVDVPSVNGAILMRPTKSLSLHLQQVGRVLRLKPDGSKAVILDHVGNVHRHGMPDLARDWRLEGRDKKKKSEFKTKTCETCFRVFQVSPGWMAEAECGDDPETIGCVLTAPPAAQPRELQRREGELAEITEAPEWAGGINVVRAAGPEFKALLAKARTREQLAEIAKIRGYKPGWVFHQLSLRGEMRAA